MLYGGDVLDKIFDTVKEEHLVDERNVLIFKAVKELHEKGGEPDAVMLDQMLNGKVSRQYLVEMFSRSITQANWEHHADQVVNNAHRRKLLDLGQEIIMRNTQPNSKIDDTIESITSVISSLFVSSEKDIKTSTSIASEVLEKIKLLRANPQGVTGLPTGFPTIDERLSGLHKTDLIILGARPARGKSSLALQIAKNIALYNKTPVLFFSLEMGAEQLMQRLIASESRIPLNKIRTGDLSDTEMQAIEATQELMSSIPLYFNDRGSVTVKDIRKHIKAFNSGSKGKIGLVVVDYLQLMAIGGKDNMVQAVTEISRGLKLLAKDFDVPVLALSQLSRGVDSRGGEPKLSDLRDSGSIEQDADIVVFLHSETPEEDAFGNKQISFMVEKHRNGATFKQNLEFNGSRMIFRETQNIDF